MKIENEIDKLTQRINLLENQNGRFKSLLDSAIEMTKQSLSQTQLQKDEKEFLSETIKLINAEQSQLQDDLISLKQSEKEDIMNHVNSLKKENADLKNKVQVLVLEAEKNSRDLTQLKLEHSEFKFLLTQPDSNAEWLKNILLLDNTVAENANINLMEQRYHLQQKVYKLERKKTELLNAIDDIAAPISIRDLTSSKTDIENTLYSTIDEVTKKEYEDLHVKILELEQERSTLLCQLQLILERSRKEIADEYCQLQKNILEIEIEKAELKNIVSDRTVSQDISTQGNILDVETIGENSENEILENVLNAFTNTHLKVNLKSSKKKRSQSDVPRGMDFCVIS